MLIRPGRLKEGPRLESLAVESKAHWGYPAAFLTRFAELMVLDESFFRSREVWVFEHDDDVAGFYTLIPDTPISVLDDLWLRPTHIGRGLGRLLFEHALDRAAIHGASRVEWEAEPYAIGFYQRMGGAPVRDVISGLGRTLTVFGVDIANSAGRERGSPS